MTISQYKKHLENYSGQTQTPEDFSQHWSQALELPGGEVRREAAPFSNPAACYETLTLSTPDGEIRARCVYPAGGGTYPLVLMYHDLNRGPRGWHHMTRFIALGCAVVAPEAPADNTSWVARPHDVDFHARFVNALALSKAALELPYVDKTRVITWGEGLGGGLAVAAAALLPGEIHCACLHPMPADFRGVCTDKEGNGFARLDYVDTVNFAPMLKGQLLLGTALMDKVAPPEGQYALYHRAGCEKTHFVYPKYEHERINFFEHEVLKFLHKVLE